MKTQHNKMLGGVCISCWMPFLGVAFSVLASCCAGLRVKKTRDAAIDSRSKDASAPLTAATAKKTE